VIALLVAVPAGVTVKSQPQLTALVEDSCSGNPVLVTFQPHCQPNTRLAYVFTAPAVPVQLKDVPQPTRSPVWQLLQMHWLPVPLMEPHSLLFTQYLPSKIEASLVQELFALAPVQLTLLGSMHAPYRQLVLPEHALPHVPQFLASLFKSTHFPLHAV